MKALLKYGWCLVLGLAPPAVLAQELQWRPANPAAPGAVQPVGLSRPVPLGDATDPAPPLVRAQIPDEIKPLPAGPMFAPGAGTGPAPLAPLLVGQPKTGGEFIGPQPKLTMPPADGKTPATPAAPATPPSTVWGAVPAPAGPLGITGEYTGPYPPDCPDSCCGPAAHCGILGHLSSCLSNLCGQGCGVSFNPDCCDCCSHPHIWAYADYLLWWTQHNGTPPLVTVSPTGTPLVSAGVLGEPTTVVAFNGFNDPAHSGFRVGGGFWFKKEGNWGVDASYWMLTPRTQTFGLASNTGAIITRPFFSVNDGTFVSQLVSFPGIVNGGVLIRQDQQLWGLDANLRRKLYCGPTGFADLLVGYRHFALSEGLDIVERLAILDPATGAVAQTRFVADRFHTRNDFDGPQFGVAGEWRIGRRWFVGGNVKVGVGVVHQVVDIAGNTGFNIPGVLTSVQTGGLLALPTNIGRVSSEKFAVMPEVGIKVGVDLTDHLRLYAGYDFLYISNVVRPGDQIDLGVNRTQIPNAFGPQPLVGTPRPAPLFNGSTFWVQGVNFGLQYHW
jgi:hypothetical protein